MLLTITIKIIFKNVLFRHIGLRDRHTASFLRPAGPEKTAAGKQMKNGKGF